MSFDSEVSLPSAVTQANFGIGTLDRRGICGSNGGMEKPATTRRRLPRVVRVIRARPRLFIAALLAIALSLLLPTDWRVSTRALVGWDMGVAIYVTGAFIIMARADVARIRRRAAILDEGRIAILVVVVGAALASLGGIVAQLGVNRAAGHLAVATITILLSWTLVHIIFALHYAHEFYAAKPRGGGLTFPGGEDPDYWDFLYFSLVIGMTSQVSDVAVTGRTIRRTVAAHGVVSFLFNAALIALTVNIAASALAG
jgi:uncharacterized membrane protein